MEDKVVTVVFGSLGATLALIGILFAYLQLRGSRHRATIPDEERVAPPAVMAREDPTTNLPAAVAREEPVTDPPAAVVQEGPVTSPPAVVLIKKPVANPPYAPSLYNPAAMA